MTKLLRLCVATACLCATTATYAATKKNDPLAYDENGPWAESSVPEDLPRPFKNFKVGKYTLNSCTVEQGYAFEEGLLLDTKSDIEKYSTLCDKKKALAILDAAAKKPANFNKDYVVDFIKKEWKTGLGPLDEEPENPTGISYSFFALNKKTNAVTLMNIYQFPSGKNYRQIKPKMQMQLSSNKFCILPQKNLETVMIGDYINTLADDYDAREYIDVTDLPNVKKNQPMCFWLKQSKKGSYWSIYKEDI
ncbi:hypothetical protein SAMN02745664_103125 [Moraxella cuniculi DSM 21768]|uniref:Uncharacterized protein n=1 Tax=Moraxella cuniculi DSM 21768 TaxID=1122245 RepID=A0A1N7E6I0_9GAMM|nr:hypothetical protein [Moraxella cuniculi]OOS06609.1 hypothetical protein B0189_04585 [Moraxella cuniculi]SIR83671.1 hypothetical protein SAMN02745664_103125 [Moraxella cuniculi DSM 21768]